MADVNTIRSTAGARAADIDAGLRAHMNKVYSTMSIGMLITFAAAWAISNLAVTSDPSQAVGAIREGTYLTDLGYAIYGSPLKWVIMLAPLAFIFGFGVFMGILVGLVIVYQVLSTDVADHLREYATFKAMGYDHPFFLGVVFEEALVLAFFGFIPGFIASLGLYSALVTVTGLPVIMEPSTAILVFFGTLAACSISGSACKEP